jgi:cytochrome c oxidase assembly protein subunit 15
MRAQRDRYRRNAVPAARIVSVLFAVALALSIAQIVLGTRIREHTDHITAAFDGLDRARWAADLGIGFYVHRSLSILVLAVNIALAYELVKRAAPPAMRAGAAAVVGLLIIEIASGAALSYLGMPAILQPVHLLLSNLIFGVQFYLWTAYRYARQEKLTSQKTLCASP